MSRVVNLKSRKYSLNVNFSGTTGRKGQKREGMERDPWPFVPETGSLSGNATEPPFPWASFWGFGYYTWK